MSPANLVRLVVLAALWGSSFLFIKLALAGLSPMQIALGRLTAGAATLVIYLAVTRVPLPRDRRVWGHFVALGIFSNIIPFYLYGWGEQRIASSLAGVINATTPLFTLTLAALVLKDERFSARRVTGLVVGLTGVALLVAPWRIDDPGSLLGILACLGAAFFYGVGFVWSRRFLTGRGIRPRALGAGQIVAATLTLWAASPLVARGEVRLEGLVVISVLAMGVGATGVAYVLVYRLIQDAGATASSLVTYLIPVFAVFLGVIFLDEPLVWNLFAGAAVVILGVAVAEGRGARSLARLFGGSGPTPGRGLEKAG